VLSNAVRVYADLRWPDRTGIGVVKQEMLRWAPASIEVTDIHVGGRIGSPYSPFAIRSALRRKHPKTGVFWSPGFMPPAFSAIPAVVTVHDLLHLRYYSRAHVAYYNYLLKPLYRRCARIICSSDNTRREFLEWSGISSDRVATVYLGVSDAFRRARSEPLLPYPYVLYPGNHRGYKNTARLLRAYAASRLPANGIRIVFTGSPQAELVREADELKVPEMVHFMGAVSEDQIVGLYQGALVVAFVSLYEGFGLPILEAMTAGVPVLTSNTSSMPEIAGNAARLIDPSSTEEITVGLDALAFDTDERNLRISLGYQRSRLFSWESTAAKVWALVSSLT
jgi:glycosyltransferase involved in cell wall biosynthesis